MAKDTGLINITQAKQLLANAGLDEVKDLRDKAKAVESYLKTQRESYEAQFNAGEIKLRAERKAGELLRGVQLHGGDRKSRSQDATLNLEQIGITKSDSSRWQQEAMVDEEIFEQWLKEVYEGRCDLTQAGLLRLSRGRPVAASANTGEVEWYTPSEYIELSRKVMGSIDVDPAASDASNETVQAGTYYTEQDNGLDQEWWGTVYMNPPYAAGVVGQFTTKLCEEIDAGRCTQAIVLLNNATDTRWFGDIVAYADAVCFKTGRIAFVNQDGDAVAGAAQGQVFLYYGTRVKTFCRVFKDIGWIAEVCHVT